MELRPLPDGQSQMLATPSVVCLAFSIEAGLKAIALSEGGTAAGHKLDLLYASLSATTQAAIEGDVGIDKPAFDAALAGVTNAFDEWRYIYEGSGVNVDIAFLGKLANAVQGAAAKARKQA